MLARVPLARSILSNPPPPRVLIRRPIIRTPSPRITPIPPRPAPNPVATDNQPAMVRRKQVATASRRLRPAPCQRKTDPTAAFMGRGLPHSRLATILMQTPPITRLQPEAILTRALRHRIRPSVALNTPVPRRLARRWELPVARLIHPAAPKELPAERQRPIRLLLPMELPRLPRRRTAATAATPSLRLLIPMQPLVTSAEADVRPINLVRPITIPVTRVTTRRTPPSFLPIRHRRKTTPRRQPMTVRNTVQAVRATMCPAAVVVTTRALARRQIRPRLRPAIRPLLTSAGPMQAAPTATEPRMPATPLQPRRLAARQPGISANLPHLKC